MEGRAAIVTGSSRGIGRAIAVAFAAEGCAVVVNYRSAEKEAAETARQIESASDAGCLVVQADVSRERDVAELFSRTVDRFGRLDILVNNAGIADQGGFLDIDPSRWRQMIDNNLTSVYLCCRAALPIMRERQWGRIINISSTSGLTGGTSGGHYAAAKGGVIALTKSLGREFAAQGITVNAIVPSKIDTDLLRGTLADEQAANALREKIPVRRFGSPQEIAGLALYLAGEPAAYITGETIVASGGY